MAIPAWQTKILLDGYDFSGQTNGVSIDIPVGVLEYGVLQQGSMSKLPSYPMPSVTHNGFYDGPSSGQLFDYLDDKLGSANDVTVGVILGTSETIPVGYVLPTSFGQQLKVGGPYNGLITLNGNWPAGQDKLYRGYQVALGAAVASTGALTGVDFAAAGSTGGKVFIFVTGIDGSATNAAIKIQSDSASNFSGAADEVTIQFSAVGAHSGDMSGTIGRYVRANVTSLGGATSLSFLIVVCVNGVTM